MTKDSIQRGIMHDMVLSTASHQGNAVKTQDATPHPLTWLKVTWWTTPHVSEMWSFWSCHKLPGGCKTAGSLWKSVYKFLQN